MRRYSLRTLIVLVAGLALLAVPPLAALAQTGPTAQDGDIVFVSDRDGNPELYLMAADGTGQRRLTTAPLADGDAAWSPDGTRLVYLTENAPGQTELALLDVTTGASTPLTALGAQSNHPVWSPDGTQIAFASNFGDSYDIYLIYPDRPGLDNLTRSPSNDLWPTWSTDGTRLAFQSDRNGDTDIYVMNADGSSVTRLTLAPGVDRSPIWSPDGFRVSFISERDGNSDVYVIDANGTNLVQLSQTPYDDSLPAWSPDGVFIAYAGGVQPTVSELFTINANGVDARQLTNDGFQITSPVWSPDGRWIAYASNRGGTFDLYALALDDQSVTPLTATGTNETAPVWTAHSTAGGDSLFGPPPTSTPNVVPPATFAPPPTATLNLPTATLNLPPTASIATPIPTPTLGPIIATLAPPPTLAPPTLTPTNPPPPDLLLVYNTFPAFDLINVSGRPLNLAGLGFQGAGRQVNASVWLTPNLSSDLGYFKVGGCLGLWGLGVPVQPLPPECEHRHSWWESDNVVFWTGGSFTVTNNGAPIAVCDTAAGRCPVSLSGAVTALPPAAPVVVPVPITNADLALIYDPAIPSFYLVNVTGHSVNIAGLWFQGAGRQVTPAIWQSQMSGSLNAFPAGGCLGIWGYGVPVQPQPPECSFRHGWQESDIYVFWTGGTFTVLDNGAPVATCDSNARRCAVDLP